MFIRIRNVIKKIFQQSRLDEYRSILQLAKAQGYIITSLENWYENNFYQGQKVLVLRHDVDLLPETAQKMYIIEKSLGVKAAYYFRWRTVNNKIMQQIHEDGFEVSLHYETLATYCKKKRIFNSSGVDEEVMNECLQLLKEEIRTFENRFWKVKTLCSHGDKRNRIIGIPNWKILDNIPRRKLGIYFETYDKDIASKFNVYISDSSINEGHRWKYGLSPEEAIKQGFRSICLLTHPNHWHYDILENIQHLWYDVLDYLENFISKKFRRNI